MLRIYSGNFPSKKSSQYCAVLFKRRTIRARCSQMASFKLINDNTVTGKKWENVAENVEKKRKTFKTSLLVENSSPSYLLTRTPIQFHISAFVLRQTCHVDR